MTQTMNSPPIIKPNNRLGKEVLRFYSYGVLTDLIRKIGNQHFLRSQMQEKGWRLCFHN